MLCPGCGTNVADVSLFCSTCGKPFAPAQGASAGLPGSPLPPGAAAQTSGKAIASLVCGIINIFPLFIVAIILGHISLSEIKKSAGRLKGEGLAIAGLILGYLGIVAIPFILIVAAIAIPNLLRARMAANEAAAVASMRAVIDAEANYQATHQEAGFTCRLPEMSGLDPALVGGLRHGYSFLLQNCAAATEGGPVVRFQLVVSPLAKGTSGIRAFCTDETGVIRMDAGGSGDNCLDHGTPLE